MPKKSLIYYDPLKPSLSYISGDSYTKFVSFMLLKCNYGDSQHIQENKDYYTGSDSNSTRRTIYSLWKTINKQSAPYCNTKQVSLNLDTYLLINNARNPQQMSTQETGNTCYFQTYLFAVLCKVCSPVLGDNNSSIDLQNIAKLEEVTITMSRFLLEFFVSEEVSDEADFTTVMRPLTNSNFVIDFYRYTDAAYYGIVTRYLLKQQVPVPDYDLQYQKVMQYFNTAKLLHKYGKFQLSGTMSSSPNSKSLQPVCGTDDAGYKLGLSNYYKYRAANLMFGFNTGVLKQLNSFCEFNALRKNQLLAFYEELKDVVQFRRGTGDNKYRDYYFMPQFEIGQKELVDLHHYTYEIDVHSMLGKKFADPQLTERVQAVNQVLVEHLFFSTQRLANYDKFAKIQSSREYFEFFLNTFMTTEWFNKFAGLGNLSPSLPEW